MFEGFIEFVEHALEDTGWAIYDPEMSPEFLLEAPCGMVVEQDGVCACPEHHVSPLREQGLLWPTSRGWMYRLRSPSLSLRYSSTRANVLLS